MRKWTSALAFALALCAAWAAVCDRHEGPRRAAERNLAP